MPEGVHSVVSKEFVGRARQTVARYAAQDQRIVDVLKAAMAPLRAHILKHPGHRLEHLAAAERAINTTLPPLGLLANDQSFDRARRTFTARQLRVCGGSFSMESWVDPHNEPALMIVLVVFEALKRRTNIENSILACISMHSLARWYMRAWDTSEVALYRDLRAIGMGFDALKEATRKPPHAWTSATDNGRFVGEAMVYQGRVILEASSFLDVAPEPDEPMPTFERPAPRPPIRWASHFEERI